MAGLSDCSPLKSLLGLTPASWERLESAVVRIGGLNLTREQLMKNDFSDQGLLAEGEGVIGSGGGGKANWENSRLSGLKNASICHDPSGVERRNRLVLESLKVLRSVLIDSENLHKLRIVTYSCGGEGVNLNHQHYQHKATDQSQLKQRQSPWIVCHGLEMPPWRDMRW